MRYPSVLEKKLELLLTPVLNEMGYELVQLHYHSGKQQGKLRILAEPSLDSRNEGRLMGVEDCALISRAISPLLDLEDLIDQGYLLEVSSPGLDRPLRRSEDFERFAGCEVRIETVKPIAGRRRFQGRIDKVAHEDIHIETQEGLMIIALSVMLSAKLVPKLSSS